MNTVNPTVTPMSLTDILSGLVTYTIMLQPDLRIRSSLAGVKLYDDAPNVTVCPVSVPLASGVRKYKSGEIVFVVLL